MTTVTKTTKRGGGIFVQDGRWVIQCGRTAVPIRLLDKDGREVPPPPEHTDVAPDGAGRIKRK